MMSEELKPCPFCGGTAYIHELSDRLYIVMCDCGASSGIEGTEKEAAAAWNRRADDEHRS